MPRAILLTKSKGGIDRQEIVGSPPAKTLYDLLNGHLYNGKRWVSRYGMAARYNLPAGATKGFTIFNGGMVVFSSSPQTVPDGVTCEVLVHPTDQTQAIKQIHFAGPFLQYLYVVAEFYNGDVYHYWLRRATTWTADTIMQMGDLVQPTVPNGYVYQAGRIGDPNPLWAASVPRTVGDRVEPTTPDGYFYTVVDTLGATPKSGLTEPDWNDEDGALTYEDVDTTVATPNPTGPTTPPDGVGTDVLDRYANPGGPRVGYRSTQ